jgi:translation elongation factor EF-Tu-like GTPase
MDGAFWWFGGRQADAADAGAHSLARQVGVPFIVVFLNKTDMVDDPSCSSSWSWRSGSC